MGDILAFDPFEVLGLPRDASVENIRSQYIRLVRRYHPNRHRGTDEAKAQLTQYFHRVQDAWDHLKDCSRRRRCIELLKLLDLQSEIELRFEDVQNSEDETDHSDAASHDGHISSDADEDLPSLGIRRRHTVLKRGAGNARSHNSAQEVTQKSTVPVIRSPFRKAASLADVARSIGFSASRSPSTLSVAPEEPSQNKDYFTERREKTKKLRRREVEAFVEYRNAKLALLEAERRVEETEQLYATARFKREYFEKTPKETSEVMRSFTTAMGAVRAFSSHRSRKESLPDVSYGILSPIATQSSNQFLMPETLQRRKTIHRRGWSSDISGDQTSSDDDSPGPTGHRRISPPGQFTSNFGQRRARDLYRPPYRPDIVVSRDSKYSVRSVSTHNPDRLDSPGGMKVLIRPPTGFASMHDAHDSSADTLSRSPSPQPQDSEYREFRYVRVDPPGLPELFGLPPDHHARPQASVRNSRSLSPGHRKSASDQQSAPEELRFRYNPPKRPQHAHIPLGNVHLLSKADEFKLLGSEPDPDFDPVQLMSRLGRLDQQVAARFVVKGDIKEQFNFRLVYGRPQTARNSRESFIALSYRRRLQVEKHTSHYTLPLDPEMFQAFWDERSSETEGVWIDQICIDQDSEEERTVSMSAMDMVYRSARLIVVALDDILLDSYEGQLLQSHISEYDSMHHVAPRQRFRRKQPAYLESHDDLRQVIRKLLKSSWFVRAWCRHEMRLARNHIFLVPCKRHVLSREKDVLRFNGRCLAHLLALSTEVPFEPEIETIKPALYAFFNDRSKLADVDKQLHSHHGNFSTVIAEVFAMEAGGDPRIPAEQRQSDARKDKIAIILNTMECGLALHPQMRQPSTHLSDNQCFHDLLLLALAAQDPGALCSVGTPLPIPGQAGSWLYTPTVADAGLNNHKTLPRLPADAEIQAMSSDAGHCVQLDMKFFRPTGVPNVEQARLPDGMSHMYFPCEDEERMALARRFIDHCSAHRYGRNRRRYLLHDRRMERLFGSMADIYAETLAAVFYCGPAWLDEVCRRYSVGRWKVGLESAWQLLVALQNTLGRWPEHAWAEGPAGFIMDFVNFLVIRGLPQRQITRLEPWRPVCVTSDVGGKALTFIPAGRPLIRTAIPKILINEDYVHLARLWVLEPRAPEHQREDLRLEDCNDWTLLGKSVVFSDEKSIEQMTLYHGDSRDCQHVFGRS